VPIWGYNHLKNSHEPYHIENGFSTLELLTIFLGHSRVFLVIFMAHENLIVRPEKNNNAQNKLCNGPNNA